MTSSALWLIGETAHHVALLPLAVWLASKRETAYGWLSVAMAVSWIADWGGHVGLTWVAQLAFVVSQAGLVMAVVLPKLVATAHVVCFAIIGIGAALAGFASGPDPVTYPVVALITASVYLDKPVPFRDAMLVYFGLGALAWWAYCLAPGLPGYLVYQLVRLCGLLALCQAMLRGRPALRVVRA